MSGRQGRQAEHGLAGHGNRRPRASAAAQVGAQIAVPLAMQTFTEVMPRILDRRGNQSDSRDQGQQETACVSLAHVGEPVSNFLAFEA